MIALDRRRRQVEAGRVHAAGRQVGRLHVGRDRRGQVAVVDEDGLEVGVAEAIPGEGRHARWPGPRSWRRRSRVDDIHAGRLERVGDALGPLAATRLGLEAPHEDLVAGLRGRRA